MTGDGGVTSMIGSLPAGSEEAGRSVADRLYHLSVTIKLTFKHWFIEFCKIPEISETFVKYDYGNKLSV